LFAARGKAYREANKEKLAAMEKAYREANKEKFAVSKKIYHEKNKENIKAYLEANKEKISAQRKAYREANKEWRRPLMSARERNRQRRLRNSDLALRSLSSLANMLDAAKNFTCLQNKLEDIK
jgi:hypothetical protein